MKLYQEHRQRLTETHVDFFITLEEALLHTRSGASFAVGIVSEL